MRVADVASGRSEPLVRGLHAVDYDISADGRQVVMQVDDSRGKQRLWVTPLDRSSPPQQIPDMEGVTPRFGPTGEIFFRRFEGLNMIGSVGSIYRVRPDGTGVRKAIEQQVLIMGDVSPDGRWIAAWAPLRGNGLPGTQLFAIDGGPPAVVIGGGTRLIWAPDGTALSFSSILGVVPEDRSYVVPLSPGKIIPRVPVGGFRSEKEIAGLPGARRIESRSVVPGPSPDLYAYYRGATQRNLYRVPIP
ncbi:MAG: hypothetical protein JO356_08595 [Acidobacteria bacterium]|nr:hypothetical protein [Acidobacteriota bacterium]